MKTMTRKMAWNIVLLCGGGMAIADGCQVGLCDFKNFLHSMFVTGSSVLQFHAIPHACNWTRMHSSRMRSARSVPYRGFLTEIPLDIDLLDGDHPGQRPPSVNRMTHGCKNITFWQFRLRAVKILGSGNSSSWLVKHKRERKGSRLKFLQPHCLWVQEVQIFLNSKYDLSIPPPHLWLSAPLKLHSYKS